ncbi:MAG TPA: hypothetical protein VEH52_00855 [Gaiellaceae bacterium]|nr:hypothetical protein [Gaiellaceae bacterium]
MKRLKILRPSPAMIVACMALAVALGGTSYAAVVLAPNSVGTVQLKNGSVTAKKVKLHSLLAANFRAGQIPRGPAGPAGPAGAAGPAGPAGPAGSVALKWAVVKPDGTIVAQSGGITLVSHLASGQYILGMGGDVSGKLVLASGGNAGDSSDQRGETTASPCGGTTDGHTCVTPYNSTSNLEVETRNDANLPADHSFYVGVFG